MKLILGKTYLDRKDRKVTILSTDCNNTNYRNLGSNGLFYDKEGYSSPRALLNSDLISECKEYNTEKETEMNTLFERGKLFQYLGVIVLSSGEGLYDNNFSGTVVHVPEANPLGYILGEFHRSWAKSDWKPYDGVLKVQTPPFKFGDKVICKSESDSTGVIVSNGSDKNGYYKVVFKGSDAQTYKIHESLEPDVRGLLPS